MHKKELDNRGMSLIELVVVMAIIVVITGIVVWGLGALLSKPAEQCAKQMEIMLQKHRVSAMGAKSGDTTQLYLYIDSDNRVMMKETINNVVKRDVCIGAKGVTVKYNVSGTWTTLTNTASGITIKFDRATGSLVSTTNPGGGIYYVKEFEISKGDLTKTLSIVPLTGRVTVD